MPRLQCRRSSGRIRSPRSLVTPRLNACPNPGGSSSSRRSRTVTWARKAAANTWCDGARAAIPVMASSSGSARAASISTSHEDHRYLRSGDRRRQDDDLRRPADHEPRQRRGAREDRRGLEGVAGASTYLGATGVAAAVAEMKPLLIGEDPLYRERIWQRLNEVSILMVPPHSIAVLDCALWDLAGRTAGLPVYKLLGAQRDRVTAYASSLTYSTLADFQREIDAYLQSGFRAVKLHVWGDP